MSDNDNHPGPGERAEPQAPSSGRRGLLVWGAAAGVAAGVASAAGVGLSLWQRGGAGGATGAPVAEPVPGFWALIWQSPQDTPVAMAQFKGRPLLINFWATWCPPCVEELPLLDRFAREQGSGGAQVLGLAVDRKDAVLSFLAKLPLGFTVALAGMDGVELGRSLGNATGGLPFSVLVGADGAIAQRKMGRVSEADLASWVAVK